MGRDQRTELDGLDGGERGRVLVVDDEPLVVSSTTRILRRVGFDTMGCCGPLEALEVFREERGRFDAVIVDHFMPGMSGLALAERLHSMSPDVPLLIVSAYTGEIDREAANRAGVLEVLTKPLTASEFLESLELADRIRTGDPRPLVLTASP